MGLIVLVSGVFVAMAGVSLAIGQSRRALSLRQNATQAAYLAQAGVMQALYDVRRGAGIQLREYVVDSGPAPGSGDDDVFLLAGKAADFLLVNMLPAVLDRGSLPGGGGVTRDRLRNWGLYNALRANSPPTGLPLTITHLTASWASPGPGEGVIRINLNGTKVWPSSGQTGAPQPSGTVIDIANVTIPSRTWRTSNTIWFSTDGVMGSKAFIDVAFRMSDHVAGGDPLQTSIRIARYTAAVATRSAELTVKSAGEVRRGAFPFVVWRRLQADYRITAQDLTQRGALVSYRELDTKSP